MIQAVQSSIRYMVVVGLAVSIAVAIVLFCLGDQAGTARMAFIIASLMICGGTGMLLGVIHRAGVPLDVWGGAHERSQAAATRPQGLGGSDEGWSILAVALLLWGGQNLIEVPGTLLAGFATMKGSDTQYAEICKPRPPATANGSDSEESTTKPPLALPDAHASGATDESTSSRERCELKVSYTNLVTVLKAFLSTGNTWLFLIAMLRIQRTASLRSRGAEWLTSQGGRRLRGVNRAFVGTMFVLGTLALLAPLGGETVPFVAGCFEFALSMAVLVFYGEELSQALAERGLRQFRLTWWTALACQAVVQVVMFMKLVPYASIRTKWEAELPSGDTVMLLSIGAQALVCVTLIAQAVSWFSAMAWAAAGDLVELRKWLSSLKADVDGSPLGEELDHALAITNRNRPAEIEIRQQYLGESDG